MDYITANLAAIPNYADRRRHGEPIVTGFTGVRRQSGRLQAHANTLLQVRARVLIRRLDA